MKRIRQAIPVDSTAIKALIAETVRSCVAEDEESYSAIFGDICTVIDSWIEKPEDIVHLVYEHDHNIVGEILISKFERMHLFFVHPSHQNKGIGRALIDRALEACRKSGKSERVTLNSSTFAASFYRNYGFVQIGEPRDLPGGCIPFAIDL